MSDKGNSHSEQIRVALAEKDAAVFALAQEVVAVVRSANYGLDALAVATALCNSHYPDPD